MIEEKSGAEMPIDDYINFVEEISTKRKEIEGRTDEAINEEYNALVTDGKIQCTDDPPKDVKIDRILSIKDDLEYRPVQLSNEILIAMEKDWAYSTQKDTEVFRMLCLDPSTNKTKITPDNTRVEGERGAGSVKIDLDLCEKSFPDEDLIPVGSFHTHPGFKDRPVESLGDVLAFAGMGKESYSCTATGWGIVCMIRKKEPAFIFDVPKTKEVGGGKRIAEVDSSGRIIYAVKSDVVDWDRVKQIAAYQFTGGVLASSAGRGSFGELTRVPWFSPAGKESSSVGTVEEPFDFGKKAAKPTKVKDLYCETFYDWFEGQTAKVRTVCDNGFYVEAASNPIIWMFEKGGLSSNFYNDVYLNDAIKKTRLTVPDDKEKSKFWDVIKPNEDGFLETTHEATVKALKQIPKSRVLSAGSIKIDGDAECEYLIEMGSGKPRALFCRKTVNNAFNETCTLL